MYKIITISILAILSSLSLRSQDHRNLRGQITLRDDHKVIPNAHVFLANTNFGTTSNGQGHFEFEQVPEGKYLLVVSSEGFNTTRKEVVLESDQTIIIEVEEQLTNLPQLVIESQTLSLGRVGMKEVPGSVSYISSDQLRRYNYSNVNDVVRMVPGISVQEEEGFGLRPNIGLRGSGLERSARITVMEDGILAAPAPYSSPSAYYFPTMGRMNGVEVLKGASQIRFGPFTTGGAINFLSTPIPNAFSGEFKLSAGNFGFRNLHAHVGNSFDQVGFMIETFQYGAGGFKTLPDGGDTGFDKKDYQVKFRINTKADRRVYQSVTFNGGQTTEQSNETYLGLTASDFERDPYGRYAGSQMDQMNADQKRFSVQHYVEIPGWFNVVTTAYRNEFNRNWYKLHSVVDGRTGLSGILADPASFDREFEILTGSVSTDTASLVLRANNREYFSQGIQSVFDFEFQTGYVSHDIHISGRIHQDQEDRFQWEDQYSIEDRTMKLVEHGEPGSQANRIETGNAFAGYVYYKLTSGRISVTPGLRYENVRISREDFGKNDPGRTKSDLQLRSNIITAWLPGVGINYMLTKNTNVFAGVHKGFAPAGSKPGTGAESSTNYELGIRKSESRISGSVVLFLSDYHQLLGRDIAAASGTGSGDIFNAGSAITRGVEVEASMEFLSKDDNGVSLPFQLTYTFTNAIFTKDFEADFEEWGDISSGDELPYIAGHQLFSSLGIQHQRIGLFVNGKYQSDIRTIPGRGSIKSDELIAAFMTLDVSTNVFINKNTSFNLTVSNLLDNQYAVATRPAGLRPGLPRTYILSAKVLF